MGTSVTARVIYKGALGIKTAKNGTSKSARFAFDHIEKGQYDKAFPLDIYQSPANEGITATLNGLGVGSIVELHMNIKGFTYGANGAEMGLSLEPWRVVVIQAVGAPAAPPAAVQAPSATNAQPTPPAGCVNFQFSQTMGKWLALHQQSNTWIYFEPSANQWFKYQAPAAQVAPPPVQQAPAAQVAPPPAYQQAPPTYQQTATPPPPMNMPAEDLPF